MTSQNPQIKLIKDRVRDSLRMYNTLTKAIDPIRPHDNRLDMFVCGPTVYDFSHVGHGRSYTFYDTFVKFLRALGISVFYLQNITDIDDKIINRAREMGISWKELSITYEQYYKEDMAKMHVNSVNLYARATEHIPEIIWQVKTLMEKGYAYEISDGIYFDVSKFPEYGKLSGQELKDLKPGARLELKDEKRTPYDFVLWKFRKPNEPFWDSEIGQGRPGWHIEDTAIAQRYHGFQYDIHGGGIDLIFPHHESEIAQMEAISGIKPFVKHWIHNGFLTINNEKMSKSLGNFFTLRDVFKKYDPLVVRYFYLQTHYRAPLEFSFDLLDSAKNRLEDLQRSAKLLLNAVEKKKDPDLEKQLLQVYEDFLMGLADDFNISKSNSAISRFFSIVNSKVIPEEIEVNLSKEILLEINSILDIFDFSQKTDFIFKLIDDIVQIRNEIRKEKQYRYSDMIRDCLKNYGIEILDNKDESKWVLK
ncbi:MAG: cysteine--tRNA ligase [Candidatus Woesearchaeota archaeon]